VKKHGTTVQNWLHFINLERHYGDVNNCRSLFKRGLNSVHDDVARLATEWLAFERLFGTFQQVETATQTTYKYIQRQQQLYEQQQQQFLEQQQKLEEEQKKRLRKYDSSRSSGGAAGRGKRPRTMEQTEESTVADGDDRRASAKRQKGKLFLCSTCGGHFQVH
jgi:hypothetical protein